MTVLPEPPAAPAAGQARIDDNARKLLDAVEEAMRTPTSFRDDTPLPRYGTTPPVQQPGIPAMSVRTAEITRAVMYCSLATVPPGLIAVAVMVASEHANPTVIGMICAAPVAIAAPILAIARLIRRAGEAAPTEIHQTYTGDVYQQTHTDNTKSVWNKTINRN